MLRALIVAIVMLAGAGPVLAAADIDACRDPATEPEARLVACSAVTADDTISGKPRGAAYQVIGDSFMKKRDYDGAIAAFSKAHDADPDNIAYINSRGIAYSSKGDDEHALADYDLCLQLRPNYASAYNNRGIIFLRRLDFPRALEEFNASIKFGPTSPSRYTHLNNRARTETLLGQYDAALADLAEALKLNADGAQVFQNRCMAYTEMKRFDEAIADCNTALAKSPKNTFVLTNRANAYLAKGDLDAALADYNEAIRIAPNYIRAHAGRGQYYEKKGDLVSARYDYRSASATLTKVDFTDTAIARRFAKDRLAALVAAAPPAAPAPRPAQGKGAAPEASSAVRKVALIIGNGAYKNVRQLDNPPRDARLIADTFRGLGFATVTLAPDLTRDNFFQALRTFGAEAEKSDWAVVYYAGHGMEIGGVNYLIPTDAKLATDHDAESQTVALEQVIAAVAGARKLKLVLLDACRDNPFEKTMRHTIALKLVSKGLSNIEPEAGFMVVYAAKHGETALDGESANSPFATVLARDIREPKVEVRKLFDIVRDDVWKATKHAQQPFTYGSPPGREDFYFVAGK